MSDPRASIQRAVAAPPPRSAAPPVPAGHAAEAARLIGKPHGRMRCVNLSLTPEAKVALAGNMPMLAAMAVMVIFV